MLLMIFLSAGVSSWSWSNVDYNLIRAKRSYYAPGMAGSPTTSTSTSTLLTTGTAGVTTGISNSTEAFTSTSDGECLCTC
ncbi:unnamed protein product [Allacma fusca]|uniref:Uncharacterized protein n=1 Tax=Allacma fusca TaxID=39272 RepID=A0A8J2PET1_9HEXA|nr:unnamed protein product [Allacma fusca]